MPEVKLINVTKRYKKITAIDHLNLHIQDKEYVTILGPTGSGKTTLLRLIAGLAEPDEGAIYIGGKLVNNLPPEERDVGYVFQNFALFPHLTVWQNVTFGPRVKRWNRERTASLGWEMLEMVKLADRADAYPHELSGGMQQRVALARALTAGTKLLLLDEPLGALDARLRVELRYELKKFIKDLGLTAIHVTHDQEEAMTISDRIVILRGGRVEQVGSPVEIYLKPKSVFIAHFVGEANFLEGIVERVGENKSDVRIRGDNSISVLNAIHQRGERVVVAVRLENMVLKLGEVPGVNHLFGRIRRIRFLGISTRYEVQLDNGDIITVRVPTAYVTQRYDIGDRVTVSFTPEKAVVYSYPQEGLMQELSVE
ncbi:ABC transporter ATP-binding protein [Candidatus Bathyarchaeota archaeon]|nr:ABC transporter ATP-binding protein [Candidatus Bathyarchaeota archaeon]